MRNLAALALITLLVVSSEVSVAKQRKTLHKPALQRQLSPIFCQRRLA